MPHNHDAEIFKADKVTVGEFLTSTKWNPQLGQFGIWPLLNSTLITTGVAMLVALPLGLSAAVYLSEYAAARRRAVLKPVLEILAGVVPCRDKSFDYLTPVVVDKASQLSSCICIFLAWDEERIKLVNHLRGLGIPTLVVVVSDDEDAVNDLDPGPMRDAPQNFHLLKSGRIQQGLMNL